MGLVLGETFCLLSEPGRRAVKAALKTAGVNLPVQSGELTGSCSCPGKGPKGGLGTEPMGLGKHQGAGLGGEQPPARGCQHSCLQIPPVNHKMPCDGRDLVCPEGL